MKFTPLYSFILLMVLISCSSVSKNEIVKEPDFNLKLENGILYFKQNPLNGTLVAYYTDSVLASEIQYVNGRKQGYEKKWFPNSSLAMERFYTKGVKTGIHKGWWESKTPQFEYHFNTRGAYNGTYKEWYATGQLYKEFHYIDGQESGKQRLWKPDGKIKANYEVIDGERFGLIGLKRCKTVTVNSNQIH